MQFHIDKNTYMSDARFETLRNAGVSYEDFSFNQNYYMNKLSKSSIMDLYKKGQEMYEKYTNLFNAQNTIFHNLKTDAGKKKIKYEDLLATYARKNEKGEPTAHDRTQAATVSGYTTELIKNVNDAEIMADIYLDQRFNAVDMQRRGLMG